MYLKNNIRSKHEKLVESLLFPFKVWPHMGYIGHGLCNLDRVMQSERKKGSHV